MKIFESHHISLLFHLDKLMEDEEPEIRDAASEIVLELFGEDELLDRSYTRVLLYSYLFVQTFSKHGLGLLRSQLLGRLYAIGSIHSVIRNQLTCHQKLYAAEKANPRREHFIDLLLTFDILRTLSREDGCIRKHLISLVDTIWDALQCLTDLGWWSGQPIVFNALVQIVEGIRLMGDSVGEKHIRIRDGIKTTPLMHPILVRLIDDHQSVEKHFLLTI